MPEPGVNDRNFSHPTAKAMRGPAGSRPGARRLRLPGEYAEFRLEGGRLKPLSGTGATRIST